MSNEFLGEVITTNQRHNEVKNVTLEPSIKVTASSQAKGTKSTLFLSYPPGRVAQSVARLTQEPEVPGPIPSRTHTFVSSFADSRRAVVSYWRKSVHEVLVNRLGGLNLPWKSVVRLTDRPDMTIDVYRGRKRKTQLNS